MRRPSGLAISLGRVVTGKKGTLDVIPQTAATFVLNKTRKKRSGRRWGYCAHQRLHASEVLGQVMA